jgi:hypothetical protein
LRTAKLLHNSIADQQLGRRELARTSSPASVSRTLRNPADYLSVLFKLRLFNLDQPGAHHRVQQPVELVPAHSSRRVEIPLQRSGSLVIHRAQLIGNRLHISRSAAVGRRKSLSTAPAGSHTSQIPHRPARVLHIAKVPHQRRHPALGRRGEPQHLLKLLRPVLRLHRVSLLPARPPTVTLPPKSTRAPP